MIDLSFELHRGNFHLDAQLKSDAQATGLFGPSGCGKTTILLAIAGLLTPQTGHIFVNGIAFWNAEMKTSLPPERRRVGMVFQDNLLFPHLDVLGNLLFGYRRTPEKERRLQLDEIADLLGLEPLLSKQADHLSGGEARRVAIGRALLTSPALLILDEPLAGLDRTLRDRILAYLIRVKRKLDIRLIYVSHSFSDLAALTDHMALITCHEENGIKKSRIAKTGSPLELFEEAGEMAGAGPVETILRGDVVAVDRSSGFATVQAEGLEIHVPLEQQQLGSRAVVIIRADEVILATGEIPKISTRNAWKGRVTNLHRMPTRTVVEVDVGQKILAEVTEDAVRDLGLKIGTAVYALVKTRSLRATGLPAGTHISPQADRSPKSP